MLNYEIIKVEINFEVFKLNFIFHVIQQISHDGNKNEIFHHVWKLSRGKHLNE